MGKELAPETISSTTTCFNVRCPEKTLSTMYSIFPMEWTHTDPETALAGRALFSCFTEFTSADIFPMLNGFITGDEYLYPYISSHRICHAPRRVRGLQKLLLAKLSQLCGVGRNVRRRAAPKSTGALAREFIICPRFHCEAACQSRFRAGVYRSGQNHHCAASQVAEPLSPRGQLTPAPCIQL